MFLHERQQFCEVNLTDSASAVEVFLKRSFLSGVVTRLLLSSRGARMARQKSNKNMMRNSLERSGTILASRSAQGISFDASVVCLSLPKRPTEYQQYHKKLHKTLMCLNVLLLNKRCILNKKKTKMQFYVLELFGLIKGM